MVSALSEVLLMESALSGVYRHYLFQETEGFKLEQLTDSSLKWTEIPVLR